MGGDGDVNVGGNDDEEIGFKAMLFEQIHSYYGCHHHSSSHHHIKASEADDDEDVEDDDDNIPIDGLDINNHEIM